VTAPALDVVVYLVRHGRTRLNAERVLRGHLNVPLDNEGRRQAQQLGSAFAAADVKTVVTSPLRRARETAEAIAATTGAPLNIEPRLIDRDYRTWAGQPESLLYDRHGSIDAAPDIERLSVFTGRIVAALDDLAERFTGERLVVVAHDAVNRHLLALLVPAMAADPAEIPQRPGCWNRLERSHTSWTAAIVDAMPYEGGHP
jgi:glucosyl-3-phosphoglycerate phosphatase